MCSMEGCRNNTELMVCTGDDEPHELDVAVDAEEERRREVRRLLGEKRERIIWKREVCMVID